MADTSQHQHDPDIDVEGQEGPDEPQNESQPVGSTIRRACDACRTRKIRCDRNSPCSHCVHAKIACTHADVRPREKRTRILLSAQYERKIDLIDRRLEGVTQLLQDLTMTVASSTSQLKQPNKPSPSNLSSPGAATVKSSSAPTSSNNLYNSAADSPVVEGESSLAAHSAFANEFLKNAVQTGSLQDSSLEMRETLDNLHHIVNTLNKQTAATEMLFPYANVAPRPSYKDHEMPPIQTIAALLRRCENNPSETAAWLKEFFPLDTFSGLCMKVYFSEDSTEADFIIANAGLLYVFWEMPALTETEKEEFPVYTQMCRSNLETALANLPLHLPANQNMIAALILGALHGIELSKPSLAWSLSCKASEMCQTLGYHRLSTMKNDSLFDQSRKLFLFWTTYFIDKSLSLRLGRASCIQDWDITVPPPDADSVGDTPLAAFNCLWTTTAGIQGRIYELLYSPDSMGQSEAVRRLRVQTLANDLESIRKKSCEVARVHGERAKEKLGASFVDFVLQSDDVLRLSLLTLVYRASPPQAGSRSTFVPECVEAARATLQRHQETILVVRNYNSVYFAAYIHWTLLFAPFIPFIVVFCQVIETQSEIDLARLHSFIVSIESAPTASNAAAKMHRLFQVLYSVALRYIESKTSTLPEDQAEAGAELNTYLSALGFPTAFPDNRQQQPVCPGQTDTGMASQSSEINMLNGMEGQRGASTMMWMGNTAQLEEWFNSNQQMMELLQEPSFSFPQ